VFYALGQVFDLGLKNSRKYFEDFVRELLASINEKFSQEFTLPEKDEESTKLIADILHEINKFIYTQTPNIRGIKCETRYGTIEYFSEFHKFWEENHRQVLDLYVDNRQCRLVAERLETNYRPFSPSSIMDLRDLSPEQVANTRLFTAIQDFGFGLGEDYYNLARQRPYLFDPRELTAHPEYINELLKQLGVSDYQPDKRIEWIRRCVAILNERFGGTAYNIGKMYNFDAMEIRDFLVKANIGMDIKKADMFLRDMQEFGIWKLQKFEEVSVAPDMNTMRIALRTGIVHTRIPLLSSFMDVFCYQYSAVSDEVSKAWRRVWELWREFPNNHSVSSPAYIDFLIYNIGRHCCKQNKRRCEIQCTLKEQEKCVLNRLTLKKCGGWCIFKGICDADRRKLNPPKSISVFGRYGWTTSYSNEGGGLGLRCS